MPLPFQETAAALLADSESLLASWLPNGKRNGREWEVGSLGGEAGRSLRVNMSTGRWSDFSDSATSGGDLISLYAAIHQIDNKTALLKLHELYPHCSNGHAKTNGHAKPATPPPVTLAPAPDSSRPPVEHGEYGNPSKTWTYRNEEGDTIGVVCRYDTPEGKQVIPVVHTTTGWKRKGFPDPRPLYNLDLLTVRAKAPVLIVEGEKTADAAAAYFPNYVVTTWPGGSKAVSKSDWSILKQRDCVIWPDNDKPGLEAATEVSARLQKSRVVVLPPGLPDKWDLADPIPDGVDIHKVLNPPAPVVDEEPEDEIPFRILGHTGDAFYYLPKDTGCVYELSCSSHGKHQLLMIAPLAFWQRRFPTEKGWDLEVATDWLFGQGKRAGMYDSTNERGRGVWIDENRVVQHLGNKLVVDGLPMEVHKFKSRYIYAAGAALPYTADLPMTNSEGQSFIEICEQLPWEHDRPALPYLFAGWCALAPICGALWWRPHIWITGERGAGKSWVLSNIVNEIMGTAALFCQGATTEAGIRQSLKSDALPVVADEMETERASDGDRQQSINLLARQCSSDTQAMQVKGSASGDAIRYTLRSMFCFASIGAAVVAAADSSRITQMELKKRDDASEFDKLKAAYFDLFRSSDFAARFRARSVAGVLTINSNGKTFARILADRLGDQRTADQMGMLLAGCYSLTSDKPATQEQAKSFLDGFDLSLSKEDSIGEPDENKCYNYLLESKIKNDNSGERSISEVLTMAFSTDDHRYVAEQVLLRHGIKKVEDGFIVCRGHKEIEKLFQGSAWSNGKWGGLLRRIKGVTESNNRFPGYGPRRSLHFPKKEDGSLF